MAQLDLTYPFLFHHPPCQTKELSSLQKLLKSRSGGRYEAIWSCASYFLTDLTPRHLDLPESLDLTALQTSYRSVERSRSSIPPARKAASYGAFSTSITPRGRTS